MALENLPKTIPLLLQMGRRSDLLTVPQQIEGSAGTGLKSYSWGTRGSSQDSPRSWSTSPSHASINPKGRATPG